MGCVVFGRVAGASAASFLLEQISSGKIATQRLGQISQHLETKIKIDPETKKVNLEFSWDDQSSSNKSVSSSTSQQTSAAKPAETAPSKAKDEGAAKAQKEYTLDEVAKHKGKGACLYFGIKTAN